MIGLLLLCLMLSVGCSSRVVAVPEVVHAPLPVHLLSPTTEPDCSQAVTNADLLTCAQARLDALRQANADKATVLQSIPESEEGRR